MKAGVTFIDPGPIEASLAPYELLKWATAVNRCGSILVGAVPSVYAVITPFLVLAIVELFFTIIFVLLHARVLIQFFRIQNKTTPAYGLLLYAVMAYFIYLAKPKFEKTWLQPLGDKTL